MNNTGAAGKTVYDIITDRIIKALEAGTVPWRRPWAAMGSNQMPRNLSSGKRYNGINVFLLASEQMDKGYRSPFWLTYNQARDLGGHVKKGEKGTPVFFWKVYDKTAEGTDGPDSEKTERRFVGRYYTVFNADQCEGLEKHLPTVEPRPEFSPIEAAEAIVAGFKGPAIRHGGDRAYYSPIGDVVQMPNREAFESPEGYYETMFHELTHSTGHESRLGRFDNTRAPAPFGSEDYSREELVAELGAAFLCADAGISAPVLGNQAAYVAGWLKVLKNDKRAVVFAAASARKAAEMVTGKRDAT